jgi:Ca-activated chloride channel family protein
VKHKGLDIVVAIDTSRSMLAEDVAPNRLTRAKLSAAELVTTAANDRLGLVAFAGTAFLQCPLTLDEEAFRQCLNELNVGIIPQGGTALAEAIQTATKSFRNDSENPRAIVLFTDGEDHEEGIDEAIREAKEANVRIYCIGVGTEQGELIRQNTEKSASDFIKNSEGQVVKSRLNEALLQKIVNETQGLYLPLRGANTMELLYDRGLGPLLGFAREAKKGTPDATRLIKQFYERFQWPLGLAILLLLAELLVPERRRVRRPEKSGLSQPSWAQSLSVLALLLAAPLAASASNAKALRLYREGRYDDALQEYKKSLAQNPKDPRLAFNTGSAAYQARQYNEALERFTDSTIAKDLKLQESAYYNMGNTRVRLGQETEDPKAKMSTWQEAVKNYEDALKLDPKDRDAQYNLDAVKKMLEELKKQQQDQKKDDKKDQDQKDKDKDKDKDKQDQQDKKDQKDQKDQQDKNQQDQQNQDQKDQKQQDKKDEQKKEPQDKPDQKDQKNQQDQKQSDQQKQDQKPPESKPEEKKPSDQGKDKKDQKDSAAGQTNQPPAEAGQTNAPAAMDGKMTPQQARQLLDSQKNSEKALIIIPQEKLERSRRILRDW